MAFGLRLASALFSIPANYIYIITLVIFLHCFYDPNLCWTRKKALLILPAFLLEALCLFLATPTADILSFISLPLLVAVIIYDYPGKKLPTAFRVFGVLLLISWMVTPILAVGLQYFFPESFWGASYSGGGGLLFVNILITVILGMILPYLYRQLYKPGIFIRCGKRERIFVWVCCILIFVIIGILSNPVSDRPAQLVMAGGFILLMVIVPIFIYSARITAYFVSRTQYQEGYMQTELEYFRQYKQTQEETKQFRHDVKNNLLCLKEMLSSGRTEDAHTYLENLVETTEALGEKYVTGDEIVDSILAAKGSVIEKSGIEFQLDGILAGGLKWKPVDVCCVFANALDNAIEACKQLPAEDRSISMKIKTAPQFWFVHIENPVKEDFDTALLFQRQGGYTSKSDSSRHGIGTYSMKHTVETYGGIVNAECVNHRFTLELMIPQ